MPNNLDEEEFTPFLGGQKIQQAGEFLNPEGPEDPMDYQESIYAEPIARLEAYRKNQAAIAAIQFTDGYRAITEQIKLMLEQDRETPERMVRGEDPSVSAERASMYIYAASRLKELLTWLDRNIGEYKQLIENK